MRQFALLTLALLTAFATLADEPIISTRPVLGFRSIDFSPTFWASVKDEHKFKGDVAKILKYEEITKAYVLRCYISVPGGSYLEDRIKQSIAPGTSFSSELTYAKGSAFNYPGLTIMFLTRKGQVGLLTVYGTLTVLELDGRYGLIKHDPPIF